MFSSNQMVALCIDDQPTILMLRQLVLSIAGYSVLTAGSGAEAMEIFANYRVDLVITEQLLPGRSGTDIAQAMKLLKPNVPIVLLSGFNDLPAGVEHVDLVLTKGMRPEEFLTEIARLVASRSFKASSS